MKSQTVADSCSPLEEHDHPRGREMATRALHPEIAAVGRGAISLTGQSGVGGVVCRTTRRTALRHAWREVATCSGHEQGCTA
jgi:hypothetical protein